MRSPVTLSESASRQTSTRRLAGIDGLRGFAALWVVFFHVYAFSHVSFAQIPGLDAFLRSGSTGVDLFLVLSGFCLYIPFAGGRAERFRTMEFLQRRGRRLIPAYYAAMLLPIALIVLGAPGFVAEHMSGTELAIQILTHVTFTHTLVPSAFFGLNGSYWSLALEWQLYLAMPLLIMGVRRFGFPKTAAAAILCSLIFRLGLGGLIGYGFVAPDGDFVSTVLPNQVIGRWAEFVLGMIAAELYINGRMTYWMDRLKFWMIVLIPLSLVVGLKAEMFGAPVAALKHAIYGCVYFLLLSLVLASNNVVNRIFSWAPLVFLGTMSYSLYLIHDPILKVAAGLVSSQATPMQSFLVLLGTVPVVFAATGVLFLTVERHTLTTGKRPTTTLAADTSRPSAARASAEPSVIVSTGNAVGAPKAN
jgi:peptidoglycan/LPS O-acetylase OafA/YrhL